MNTTTQTASCYISGELKVINMCGEDFVDAMFFLDMSKKNNDDEFRKRRYLRAALVFFCATAEAWARQKIINVLKAKESLTSKEKSTLHSLVSNDEKSKFWNVPELFKEELPNVCGMNLDKKNSLDVESYIELSRIRNNFIHYSDRSEEEQYDTALLEEKLKKAPKIIRQLIEPYEDINEVHWYCNTINKYEWTK